MRSINPNFYKTKLWEQVRKSYALSKFCICERCNKPVYVDGITEYIDKENRIKGIVHHKEHLNQENYIRPEISYDENNLELLCIECHNKEHFDNSILRDGYIFDEDGNLVSSK